MNITSKKLKYNDLTYRKYNSKELFKAKNLLKELQRKIKKHELNETINFKLYDLAYIINDEEVDLFNQFCDEVYNFYFMEDIEEADLTNLIELRQLGRTSSNWIYSNRRLWNNTTYDEILEWTISDIINDYSPYMNDIIYYLEELNSDVDDVIKYKNIYNGYIDNQVSIFKEWIKLQ